MKSIAIALSVLLNWASAAAAESSVPCLAFSAIPLNLKLEQPALEPDSETNRCPWQKLPATINSSNTRIANGGSLFGLFGPGTITPLQIYSAAFPGVAISDTLQAVLDVAPGDQHDNLSAISGYVRNRSGSAGVIGKGNAAALFGSGITAADNSAVWGVNTLLTDNMSRNVTTGIGRTAIGAEFDFNVMSPGTQLIGISIGGNSLAQPTNANGFLVNTLGNGKKWGTGFWVLDGTAERGLVLGASTVSGVNSTGIPIWFQAFDGRGTKRTSVLRQDGGYITMADISAGLWPGLKIQQGNLSLDAGHSIIIGGQTVLTGRQTGWTAGKGTPNRGAFNADHTQTINVTYTQAQVQALQDQLLATQQRLLAIESVLIANGLIGH